MSSRLTVGRTGWAWDETPLHALKIHQNIDCHYSPDPYDHDATARPASRSVASLGASPNESGCPGGEITAAGVSAGPLGTTGGTVNKGSEVRAPASVTQVQCILSICNTLFLIFCITFKN